MHRTATNLLTKNTNMTKENPFLLTIGGMTGGTPPQSRTKKTL